METPKTVPGDPFHKGFGMYLRPHQDFLYISRRFYSHWEHVITGHDVIAVDPHGNSRQLKVGLKQGRPAFTSGVQELAQFYSLNGRSLLHFKYDEPLTFNLRIFRNNQDGPEINYPGDPPVIDLVTDSESEPEDDVPVLPVEQATEWEKVVNDRILQGRAPLHLPATVFQKLLLHGMTKLNVRVLPTNLTADCEIRPAARSKNEAYLMTGWYGLCKELELSTGNKLKFTFVPTDLELLLRVVRSN